MRFSIAIPVYGQANFLSSALESIRVQAQDVEVAVMDATPDDSVQKVLDGYLDLLAYHRHGPDSGQASAIQEGWDKTTGDILAWLCADDYYFPDCLAAVRKVFVDHPEVDVVYGDSVFVDDRDNFLQYFPAIDSDISTITESCCITQPSCFVRRTAMEKIGRLNSRLHYIMDWDLWTRLYRSGARFYYLNKPLSVARIYEGTKTSSHSWRRFYEIGRHLWNNTTSVAAVKSLIRFYKHDLLTLPSRKFERLLLTTLNAARLRLRRFRSANDASKRFKYGLSLHGNEVINEADIYLPWYSQIPPATLRIKCDLEITPIVQFNGLRLTAKPGATFCYEVPPFNLSYHLLHIQLSSQEYKPWHLHRVEINTCGHADA